MARMPIATALRAVSCPMLPSPMTPITLPAASRPCESMWRGQVPASTARVEKNAPRSPPSAAVMTYSATDSAFAPVAGITSIARASQAARSMLSSPEPSRPITFTRAAASSTRPRTCVRLRTIHASAVATAASSAAGSSTSFGR